MTRQSNRAVDQETRQTLRALRRAARRARELGEKTGTPVYVIKDHHIVDLTNQGSAILKRSNTELAGRKA